MSCNCGCDDALVDTPASLYNRPGLPALSYRAGTHGRFRETMLARLSSRQELAGLTTREPDDPAIALLDCWALIGDVLTFYQERIANEGYLHTATEQGSLEHLGKLVGYTPRPPLASSTYLAYTLDPDARSVIPAGSGAKSVPEQGQLPQTYETSEELVARAEWNTLEVRKSDPPNITSANVQTELTRFDIAGTAANLKAGDRLLFLFGTKSPGVRLVWGSTPDFQANRTSVTLVSTKSAQAEFDDAIDKLSTAVDEARSRKPDNEFAAAIDQARLAPLQNAFKSAAKTPDDVLEKGIAYHLARLREDEVTVRLRSDRALKDWIDLQIKTVLVAGQALMTLVEQRTRRSPQEVEELRDLANWLSCRQLSLNPSRPPCTDAALATGLIGLAPILPLLRRQPSRPPRNNRALAGKIEDLFRADSDTHPRLLIAADPRLAPNLRHAWKNQMIAPPTALSGLQVMRLKARVTGILSPELSPEPAVEVQLDAVYEAILPGSWVVLESNDSRQAGQVLRTEQVKIVVMVPGLAGPATDKKIGQIPVTKVTVAGTIPTQDGTEYVLWAQGDELTPLGDPVPDDVGHNEIELAKAYDGLLPGRCLIVSGERTDLPHTNSVTATELAMVAGVRQRVDPDKPGDTVRTTLLLVNDLAYSYRRDTVVISGNVVEATQGETRNEVFGSGDASQPNQSFRLRQVLAQAPLTWTAADTPLGAENTLTTRVNGVAWQQTGTLISCGPNDHAYTLDNITDTHTVVFGDGVHGARLPNGLENVTARYRTGAGSAGNVDADKITQLTARPLGVGKVTNPLPATDGADGDGPGDIRNMTALRMLALDRLVSVRDYEDFTRARAGIGKASAVKLFDGQREVVHVTIAGIGDVPIDPASKLFSTLESSLMKFGDLGVPVRLSVRERVLLVLSAGIKLLPDYSWELVEPLVRAALLAEFSFTARSLGEPAYLSQAIAAAQRVDGVDYVDADVFTGIRGDVTPIQLATITQQLKTAAPYVLARPGHFAKEVYQVESHDTPTLVAHRFGLTLDELAELNPWLAGATLSTADELTVFRGIRPAQLAVLSPEVPEALTLRRIL